MGQLCIVKSGAHREHLHIDQLLCNGPASHHRTGDSPENRIARLTDCFQLTDAARQISLVISAGCCCAVGSRGSHFASAVFASGVDQAGDLVFAETVDK